LEASRTHSVEQVQFTALVELLTCASARIIF